MATTRQILGANGQVLSIVVIPNAAGTTGDAQLVGLVDANGTALTPALDATLTSGAAKAQGNVASGATDSGNPVKVGGVFNSSAPTYTSGQRGDVQLDSSGNIKVAIAAGGGSGGTASTVGSAYPATATAIGVKNGANMTALVEGQATMANSVPVVLASDQSALPLAPLPAGTNTIGSFKQTDGTNTATVTAAGAQKVDGSAVTQPVSAATLPLPTGAALDATLTSGAAKAQGNVASGATDSGNPVKVGGVFNSSAPTLSTGQRGDVQLDVHGNLKVIARATSRVYPSNAARGGTFALTGAGVFNDVLTFSATVNSISIQNNTASAINVVPGTGTAPASGNVTFLYDEVIPGNSNALIQLTETADWVGIYGSAATKVNQGTASTGLVVYGGS